MTNRCGGSLAVAVSLASRLRSFSGVNGDGQDWVRTHMRTQSERPFAVGFITHLVPELPGYFEVALEASPPAVVFPSLSPSSGSAGAKDTGAVAIWQVQTLEMAADSVYAGAEILIAQRNEAGGLTGALNRLSFLTTVLDQYPDIPVLKTGGSVGCGSVRGFGEHCLHP